MTHPSASRRVAGAEPRRTADLARAHRAVGWLEAGTISINAYNLTPVEAPFGGIEGCDLGRENGLAGIERHSGVKSVYAGPVEGPF